MKAFFYPSSIVIVGVSLRRQNLGKIILLNNLRQGFRGRIFCVGSEEGELEGVKVYSSIKDLPATPEVAIIITPAETCPDILEECGKKGITHAVIESGGFSEFSSAKNNLEQEVLDTAAHYGIRIIGPNCIGTINNEARLMMPFAFFKMPQQTGKISVISQSGGVGDTYIRMLNENHLFMNKFASTGNKLDIDEVDFLSFYLEDPGTEAVLMYLEGFSRGRDFFNLAMNTEKPLVVMKSNRSKKSEEIARSHTTALSANDRVVDAAFRQSGIIRVRDEDELTIAARAITLPPMKGNRTAVLSRSGGHAVITADACDHFNFTLAEFPEHFYETLKTLYKTRVISHQNPLDLGEIFDYTIFIRILEEALKLDNVDGIIFNHLYQSEYEAEMSRTFLDGVSGLSKKYGKPVMVTLISDADELLDIQRNHEYPTFTTPFQSAMALDISRRLHERNLFKKNRGTPKSFPPARKAVLEARRRCCDEKRIPLTDEALEIIKAAGIDTSPSIRFENNGHIDMKDISFPVALKLLSRDASHKSDAGGVALDIRTQDDLEGAIHKMKQDIHNSGGNIAIDGFMVQEMASPGGEFFAGGRRDPVFGEIVMAGYGGIFLEITKDTAIRLAPVTEKEAREMIMEFQSLPLLQGARGRPPLDIEAFTEIICRISFLLTENPEIEEIDCNPVIIHAKGEGATAVDARIFFSFKKENI